MDFSLGYLMGLIVGEGSFTVGPRLSMTMHVDDPKPMLALQERFGGKIYGPYTPKLKTGKSSPMWQYYLGGQRLWEALPVFDAHLPESKKRVQFERWLITHERRFGYHARKSVPVVKVLTKRVPVKALTKPIPRPDPAHPTASLREQRRQQRKRRS